MKIRGSMRRAALIGGVFGVAAAIANLRGDGTSLLVPAVLACAGAFMAGALHPYGAWRWGLLALLSVPLSYAVAEALELSAPFPQVATKEMALALVAPLLSAQLGTILFVLRAKRRAARVIQRGVMTTTGTRRTMHKVAMVSEITDQAP